MELPYWEVFKLRSHLDRNYLKFIKRWKMCTQKQGLIQDFPWGGMDPFWGGFGLQRGHFSEKMYAKMKELGPEGGFAPGTPPRSAYAEVFQKC